jgi:16S rRNA (cytidine1402-2'-O)-methyltransferase
MPIFTDYMALICLIPTPVGNLEDITLRAVRMLKEADLIVAEDTRQTSKLLQHLGISKPMTAVHAHNEHQRVPALVAEAAERNLKVAICTDAGTPGISDPGFLFVREAIKLGVPIETLPGPTAFVPALVSSGLPADRFLFEGFLPPKKGRRTRLESLRTVDCTMIFYEAPHRLDKALEEFIGVFGPDRLVSVAREISKIHEEHVRGPLGQVQAHFQQKPAKGEIVIVLAGQK